MVGNKWRVSCVILLALAFHGRAFSSTDTIGLNGIRSEDLRDKNGDVLTGLGIGIGQVEVGRPVKSGVDTSNLVNQYVSPEAVFRLDGGPSQDADSIMQTNGHATQVASVMISTDLNDPAPNSDGDAPLGVAIEASLYASAFDEPTDPAQPEAALAAQHVALQHGGEVRAINFSFLEFSTGGHTPDGNSLLTLFVDWSAAQHNVLYVVIGRNDTFMPGQFVPSDNYNGLTIAASTKQDGVYRRVASFNDFTEDADGPRTSIDLLAPGDNVEVSGISGVQARLPGTSFAAPHVTGTVALLQQYAEERIADSDMGWGPNARRHEVMKAVLMNSADKLKDDTGNLLGMERTVTGSNGTRTWLNSPAYGDLGDAIPLDTEMGAGHLNAKRALQQFSFGEQDFDAGAVSVVGWDYGLTDGQDEFNKYTLDAALTANQFVSMTLAWDREVFFEIDDDLDNEFDIGDTFLEDTPPIDLNLYLMPAGETDVANAVAKSIADDTSVEHIFFEIDTAGMYEIWVGQASGGFAQQTYALAWWMDEIANPAAGGDYDGNGMVEPEDYDVWKASFGTANAAADGNGNGIVDAADYTVWRDNLGAGSGSLAAVPEPGSAMLLAVAGVLLGWRKRG